MRADIVPGARFPDYELPDLRLHASARHRRALATRDREGRSCLLSFSRDPLPDVGWAMDELRAFPLARAEEADHIDVHDRDLLQIQGDLGAAHSHLASDVEARAELGWGTNHHPPDRA